MWFFLFCFFSAFCSFVPVKWIVSRPGKALGKVLGNKQLVSKSIILICSVLLLPLLISECVAAVNAGQACIFSSNTETQPVLEFKNRLSIWFYASHLKPNTVWAMSCKWQSKEPKGVKFTAAFFLNRWIIPFFLFLLGVCLLTCKYLILLKLQL